MQRQLLSNIHIGSMLDPRCFEFVPLLDSARLQSSSRLEYHKPKTDFAVGLPKAKFRIWR
jgi:hypothetical protein